MGKAMSSGRIKQSKLKKAIECKRNIKDLFKKKACDCHRISDAQMPQVSRKMHTAEIVGRKLFPNQKDKNDLKDQIVKILVL